MNFRIDPIEKIDVESGLTLCIEFGCNCDCISCMIRDIMKSMKPIPFKEFRNRINENRKTKEYKRLILSGAEVTVNKDLPKFIKYAKDFGNFEHIQLQTNGRKLSNLDYCKKVMKAGANEFFVSILSDSPGIHDKMTQRVGSFKGTLRGLENLKQLNATVITNTVLTALNYDKLPKVVDLVSKFENIKMMYFWNYWPMSENDKFNLLADIKLIKPYLMGAIEKCIELNIIPIIKHFPACILGKYSHYLSNCLANTIIDDKYWDEHDKNKWSCLFSRECSYASEKNNKCSGLPIAYIHKFGWEEDKLTPVKAPKCKFSKNKRDKQIQKYLFHKKTFHTKDSIYSKLFEDLLKSSSGHHLECSCKIKNNDVNPNRFNIWYNDKKHVKNINLIFDFFKKISALPNININYKLIKAIFDRKFDLTKIQKVIAGVDYGHNLNNCRVKIWFVIKNYPEKFNRILSIYNEKKIVKDLIINNELLFGFDFFFGGRTRLKVYPRFNLADLKKSKMLRRLDEFFSPKIVNLLKKCSRFRISFNENTDRILHLFPLNSKNFVKNINNELLTKICNNQLKQTYPLEIISLTEGEIIKDNYKTINIYY